MKKSLLVAAAVLSLTACQKNKTLAPATQDETGKFQTVELSDNGRLYIYNSGDVMLDASFIVEGKDSLVVLEAPLFKDGAAEFEAFIQKIGKPVEAVITDYHEGGITGAENILAEGFPAFINGPIYGGMMGGFKQAWGDTMVELPSLEGAKEVPFGDSITLDGVSFRFEHGASSDFPAASIIIENKAYLTHWAPAQAHMSPLQLGSREAVAAELLEAQNEKASGCSVFIGGHGGLSSAEALDFKIQYLETLQSLFASCETADAWQQAVVAAYPDLAGQDNVVALAAKFYPVAE